MRIVKKKDCIVYKKTDSDNEMLDYVLEFKKEPKRVNNKNVRYNLYTLPHSGSGLDSYVVLNDLPQGRTIISLIKNVSGIVPLKNFNGHGDRKKKILNTFILDVKVFITTIRYRR